MKDDSYEAQDDDLHVHVVSEDRVDLTPFAEEALFMAIPIAPLCNEQCMGLCPVCGQNRNEIACRCKVERIDPRLAVLGELFERKK